ncbi:vacuolar protein sorting-associated protein 36 [Gautieria morchelliformis]|nr:vacuolar protein sorting-associated protein 36 [Gautieria morchelliformis]
MNRHARPLDGALPVAAILYGDEQLVASQDGVGLYDANQKSLDHQLGTVHVTTHRLIYTDAAHPQSCSLGISLAHVSQTEYYAGFLKSSPKVTLFLARADPDADDAHAQSWVCQVCSYRNPPGLGDAARACSLCGVIRDGAPPSITTVGTGPKAQELIYSGNIPSSLSSSASAIPARPQSSDPGSIACPACTFLNHPSLRSCEICSTPLDPEVIAPASRSFKSAPTSRPDTPTAILSERDSIKISFRRGGDKPFYAALKRTLIGKAWEVSIAGSADGAKRTSGASLSASNQSTDAANKAYMKSGIHRILQNVDDNAKNADETVRSALQDLEALMAKARDMVELTSSLNAKLTAQEEQRSRMVALRPELTSSSTLVNEEPEEAKFIRSSLSQLGLQTSAVTQDMVKDDKEWIEQLARELGSVLVGTRNDKGNQQAGLMRDRGIVGLDEIWGGWNRARGVALIPPETMMLCLPHLPMVTKPPIRLRTFRSGLRVLHTPEYTEASFTARLVSLMSMSGPRSTMEIAIEEGISDALTTQMMEGVEEAGEILRDEQGPGGEIRWWRNVLREYSWDAE